MKQERYHLQEIVSQKLASSNPLFEYTTCLFRVSLHQ